MIWVNGVLANRLPVTDRGLQYGDGVWETIAFRAGRLKQWDAHIARLKRGMSVLKLPTVDVEQLQADVLDCLSHLRTTDAVVKIIITRGSGGRGYSFQGLKQSTVIISLHPMPVYDEAYYTDGINLALCDMQLADQPLLAGFKHLNRLEQVMARAELDEINQQSTGMYYAEGLVTDLHGHVIEATMSNLFIIDQQGGFHSPLLDGCGIEGIVKQCVIDKLAQQQQNVAVRRIALDEVVAAQGLFLCNSVIGIWPVRQFMGKKYPVLDTIRNLQVSLQGII